jgi:hypothetical protein
MINGFSLLEFMERQEVIGHFEPIGSHEHPIAD